MYRTARHYSTFAPSAPRAAQGGYIFGNPDQHLVDDALQIVLDMAIEKVNVAGRKFVENDLLEEPVYQTLSEQFIKNYKGDFEFVVDLRSKLARYNSLSVAQLKGALNCLVADERRRLGLIEKRTDAQVAPAQVATAQVAPAPVTASQSYFQPVFDATLCFASVPEGNPALRPGWYTVVLPDNGHVTLRLRETKPETLAQFRMPEGTLDVAFLKGSDNTGDYQKFAWAKGGRDAVLFRDYKNADAFKRQRQALEVLMGAHDLVALGKAYAMESNRCYVCNRLLTTPQSISEGIGPICKGNIG